MCAYRDDKSAEATNSEKLWKETFLLVDPRIEICAPKCEADAVHARLKKCANDSNLHIGIERKIED